MLIIYHVFSCSKALEPTHECIRTFTREMQVKQWSLEHLMCAAINTNTLFICHRRTLLRHGCIKQCIYLPFWFLKKNNFFLCRLNFYSCLLTHLIKKPSNMTNNIYNYRMLYHLQLWLRNFWHVVLHGTRLTISLSMEFSLNRRDPINSWCTIVTCWTRWHSWWPVSRNWSSKWTAPSTRQGWSMFSHPLPLYRYRGTCRSHTHTCL